MSPLTFFVCCSFGNFGDLLHFREIFCSFGPLFQQYFVRVRAWFNCIQTKTLTVLVLIRLVTDIPSGILFWPLNNDLIFVVQKVKFLLDFTEIFGTEYMTGTLERRESYDRTRSTLD